MRGFWGVLKDAWQDWSRNEVRVTGTDIPRLEVTENRQGSRYWPPVGTLVEFKHVRFEDVDFSGAAFEGFTASEGSVFERCDFRRMRARGGSFCDGLQVVYRDCRFERAGISHFRPGAARFERCDFQDLRDWLAIHTEFVDCTFSGELRDVRFSGRPVDYFSRNYRLAKMRPRREVNEVHGNDFRSADMVGVSFVFGVKLDDQRLPDGPEYIRLDQFSRRARMARSKIEGWDDRDARDEALRVLDIYQGMSESLQQDDLFARKDELAAPIEVLERLWRLLEEKM